MIVPVDPIAENPSSVPIVQATSAALLVVRLGESLLASARSAIEVVGRAQVPRQHRARRAGAESSPSLHLMLPVLALLCVHLLAM